MSNINPYDLGSPVYKQDQVITQFDLRYILAELQGMEDNDTQTEEAYEKLQTIKISFELLLDWLVSGKTKDIIKGE